MIAGELLARSKFSNYRSGFDDIDAEQATDEEIEDIKKVLVEYLEKHEDPRKFGGALCALGKSYDPTFLPIYIAKLEQILRSLLDCNGALFQALVVLNRFGEPVFEGTSQSIEEVGRHVEQAREYLKKHGILVPW
ncbi:MAG TPA: hypothetical protein VID27_15165 [Blastocatellia bacterium]